MEREHRHRAVATVAGTGSGTGSDTGFDTGSDSPVLGVSVTIVSARPEGVAGILDDDEIASGRLGAERVEIDKLAGEVNRADRAGANALLGRAPCRLGQVPRLHQPGARVDVGENDFRADEPRTIRSGGEGDGWDDYAVARSQAKCQTGEVQSRRAAGAGDRVAGADLDGESVLERLDRRPGGQPLGTQHGADRGDIIIVDSRAAIGQHRSAGPVGGGVHTVSRNMRASPASSSQSALQSLEKEKSSRSGVPSQAASSPPTSLQNCNVGRMM